MLTTTSINKQSEVRDDITKAYRMDETIALDIMLPHASFTDDQSRSILKCASDIAETARLYQKNQSQINQLMYQYQLSTDEGIALMSLAEALLRIPDRHTIDQLISDKLADGAWLQALEGKQSLLGSAANYALAFSGKVYRGANERNKNFSSTLKKLSTRLGATVIRPIIFKMMQWLGKQFVMGETIEGALQRSKSYAEKGYLFSYDMLGESARSQKDVEFYFAAYHHAIHAVGKHANFQVPEKNPGISVKLSALCARFDYLQAMCAKKIIVPQLLDLARLAKKNDINLTIDAEEADRLDMTLDIFEEVFQHEALRDWHGLGLALQAYQKRAYYVVDWIADLAKARRKRIMLRLVKGAYWDTEIKLTQTLGLRDYPVFTRKNNTDVSYIACAKKMLEEREYIYSQFATHNAQSIAAILEITSNLASHFEFQCLHGMGEAIYHQFINKNAITPVRIYAPVGSHKELLGYLVRRLLENGANTSFINQLADEKTPIEELVKDPILRVKRLEYKPHPAIPQPSNIYGHWQNAAGLDLSDQSTLRELKASMSPHFNKTFKAASIINGKLRYQANRSVTTKSPVDLNYAIGQVVSATSEDIEDAIQSAFQYQARWRDLGVEKRCQIFERAAEALENSMPLFLAIISQEGGRTIPDALSEIREAIDYCRYYAYRARIDLRGRKLPGPTGEENLLSLHPRGTILCISPWNFPLAIFMGQMIAALVVGNTVLAKPAEQTPIIAMHAVQLLHQAGVPGEALQLILGKGSEIGQKLVADERINGVLFTGGTKTAKIIEQTLSARNGPQAMLIAETGGQNAMIVDSSALPEQTILDIQQSAFNSAGQRCSALRVLYVQEDIADRLIDQLVGYMQTLVVGDPRLLETDVGPIIGETARNELQKHEDEMIKTQKLLARTPLSDLNGCYFAPCLIEIPHINVLKKENFGPILHLIRYKAHELDKVLAEIQSTGFGLTLGIQSRVRATVQHIVDKMPVGNIYVNRNMIGAVVGVQPFGGEGLSGTGPKAGGPHYLPRLCVERTLTTNTTAIGGNAKLVSLLEED